jgi:hypothetical protein
MNKETLNAERLTPKASLVGSPALSVPRFAFCAFCVQHLIFAIYDPGQPTTYFIAFICRLYSYNDQRQIKNRLPDFSGHKRFAH